jgi:hypothetical protein
MGFPVPEIVFQVIAAVFKDVVMLVLYFPPGTPAQGKTGRVICRYCFIRYPGVIKRPFVFFPVPYRKGKIVYKEGPLIVPYFNAVKPPVGIRKAASPVPFPHGGFLKKRVFNGLGEPRVGIILAGKDKTVAVFQNFLAKRVV